MRADTGGANPGAIITVTVATIAAATIALILLVRLPLVSGIISFAVRENAGSDAPYDGVVLACLIRNSQNRSIGAIALTFSEH